MKLFITLLTILAVSSCNAKATNSTDKITLDIRSTLILSDEVSDQSVAKLLLKARELDSSLEDGEPLYLVLNTPGGSISAGMELIDGLNALDRPVHTVTLFAASMGFQIAQGLKTRFVTSNGEYMSHKAKGSFGVLEFAGKEPSQMTNRVNSWLEKIKRMDLLTVKRTKGKQTLESYQDAYENELWIDGQKAVDAGYADQVVKVTCNSSLSGVVEKEIYFLGIPIVLTFSACPTITGILSAEAKIRTIDNKVMTFTNFKQMGGQFGLLCSAVPKDSKIPCSSDFSLTEEKVQKALDSVKDNSNKRKVVYLSF